MEDVAGAKSARLLVIYSRLVNGDVIRKSELSEQYHVSERSIQRDMESLRCFIANQSLAQEIIYDYKMRGYRLVNNLPKGLSNSEILAVCKILLESRSMRRDEMLPILDRLIDCAVPEESRRAVTELIANEKYHYIEPHHEKPKNFCDGFERMNLYRKSDYEDHIFVESHATYEYDRKGRQKTTFVYSFEGANEEGQDLIKDILFHIGCAEACGCCPIDDMSTDKLNYILGLYRELVKKEIARKISEFKEAIHKC